MRLVLRFTAITILALLTATSTASEAVPAADAIPTPEEYFGRRIGEAGVLIRHAEILDYYRVLAERSDRIRLHVIGETTLGRPFYYALATSSENLSRIDELVADNAKLYDPRGVADEELERIVREGKTFVVANHQIHSTEVGASQAAILLAHRLATADDPETLRILDDVVVVHVPVHNPDGQEMVIDWLEKWRGTEYENARPPFLYHHYAGHDNNRDWYMFALQESRLSVLGIQNVFHPQFTLDQHQQGMTGSRIFVPPFEDPWEPNVDSALIASNSMIGTYLGQHMTSRGYSGVEWGQRYDAWSPSRAYYHTHGGVRILTEVASANFTDPVEIPFARLSDTHRQRHSFFPMPWPGGVWDFRTVVDYHLAAARAALSAAADLRQSLLSGMLAAQRRSVAPGGGMPSAFVFPADQVDPTATARLLRVLRIGDVEVERSTASFEADGRAYGEGSWVVRTAQPAGRFAKSLLERQEYPSLYEYEGGPLNPPYDVTVHTLPLLMGVRVDTIEGPLTADLESVAEPRAPEGAVHVVGEQQPVAYLIDPRVARSYTAAAELGGSGLRRAYEPFTAGGREWPAGTWLVVVPEATSAAVGATLRVEGVARRERLQIVAVDHLPEVRSGWVGAPRIAIYQSYETSMPEGWTRLLLDEYRIPYDILHDADIRSGDLVPFAAILLPPGSARALYEGRAVDGADMGSMPAPGTPPEFAGGLGDQGVAALRQYVDEGGTVVTWAGSTEFAVEHLGVEATDVTAGIERTDLNIPGSLLWVDLDPTHPLGFGLPARMPVLFWNAPAWADGAPGSTVVARYPDNGLLASGWIQGEDLLVDRVALVDVERGEGHLVLAGFSPEYRGQAHLTFRVLLNAALRGTTER